MIIAKNYEILKRLGEGGVGVVYLAKDLALDKLVALKMLSPHLAHNENFLARFRIEARAQAKFDHPNVVRIYSFLEHEGRYFLVMEYVDGATLHQLIHESERGFSLDRAWPLLQQALAAIEDAHHLGIIHRDFKPQNILIDRHTNRVKVTDFGLARIQNETGLTTVSATGGTLAYMSPEQIKTLSNVDYRTDIYALGMTMYEMLAGATPFAHEESDYNIRHAIVEGKIPNPRRLNSALSRDVAKVIMKALARDPDDRFRSVGEMRKALEELAAPSPSSPTLLTRLQDRPKGRGWYAVAIVMIAVLAFWLFKSRQHTIKSPEDSKRKTAFQPPDSTKRDIPIKPAPPTQMAQISIKVVPWNAVVSVDETRVSPARLAALELAVGTHEISMVAAGYLPKKEQFVLAPGANSSLTFTLEKIREPVPEMGKIHITSEPSGAAIFLNDRKVGTTPLVVTKRAGKHQLLLRKVGFKDYSTAVTVEQGALQTVEARLNKLLGTLKVLVMPFGSVYVDEQLYKENTDRQVTIFVAIGIHRLKVVHPTFGLWEKSVTIEYDREHEVTIDFNKTVKVMVTLTSPQWGEIYVDHQPTGFNTPKQLTLRVGRHTIAIRREGYIGASKVVDLENDCKEPLAFILKKFQ